jgi:hypothetical protein
MIISFRCYYCSNLPWIKKEDYSDHMQNHKMLGDDFGTISIPDTFDKYVSRLSAVGLFNESDVKYE